LQDSDLRLVAAVDERPARKLFGLAVHSPDELVGGTIGGRPFDRLVVMCFDETDRTRSRLDTLGVPPERVF
jgi:hypothetical protein